MDRRMRASRAQEKRGADQHGGRVQPGSGSGRYQQGDVKTGLELIEYKRTDAQSIIVKAVDLVAIRDKALVANREPLFGIEVGGRDYLIAAREDVDHLIQQRAERLARDIVQRRLGDAGPAQSEVQSATKVRRRSQSRERPVLPGAASVSEGQRRPADDAAGDGRNQQGLLSRSQRRTGVPRADRMPRMGTGKPPASWGLGRNERAGAVQTARAQAARSPLSRLIGGGDT